MSWFTSCAQVVKLVDTLASGASGFTAVEVQVLSWAPLFEKALTFKELGPFYFLMCSTELHKLCSSFQV